MQNTTKNKIDRISPSMMIDYKNCPLSFYYKYIAKIRLPQKQIHLLFGGAVHEGIEANYNGNDPYSAFDIHFDINKLLDEEKNLFEEYARMGHFMLKNYIEKHPIFDKMFNLNKGEAEKYVRRILINPLTKKESTIPMSGKIDRITDEGRIVEYKTAKNKWSKDDVAFSIQKSMYNLWYYSEYGKLSPETVYIILLKKLRKRESEKLIQVLTMKCTEEELASTFNEVELTLQKINNGQFERNPHHAIWCDCKKYEAALNIN